MSEDFKMVAPKKVSIMTRVPLIIQLPGNQTQNFERVQTQSSEKGKFRIVPTETILFFKSMSERVGSDIDQH